MKPKDVLNEEEKDLKDIKNFHYVSGSISRLDREQTPEEIRQEIADRQIRGVCARCEKPVSEDQEFCANCGARQN
jgi:hypothetical protein